MTTAAPPRNAEIIPLESQRAAAASLARAIRERHTFLALTGECDVGKSIVLDAALVAVAEEVFPVMVSNPRSGPLSLGSVLRQIAQYAPPPASDADEDDIERIHAMLQAGDRERFLIVVEDAETLQPKALSFLQFLPELSGQTSGGVQILLVGGPGMWSLMDGEGLARIREQLAARIVVHPLSDEEARYFAAWRCRERLGRFGPRAADKAMVGALVRYGAGRPARIDALIDEVARLAPSHGGADAALVAEAAEALADGSPGPVPIVPLAAPPAVPVIEPPQVPAPDHRSRIAPPAAPAVRRRRWPAALGGLIAAAVILAAWLSFGGAGVPWLAPATKTALGHAATFLRLGVPWMPGGTKTAMMSRTASASGLGHKVSAVGVSPVNPPKPPSTNRSGGAAPPAPGVPETSAVGMPPASSTGSQPAVVSGGPNAPAPATEAVPAVGLPAAPPAAPDTNATGASLAQLRKEFDAFLARAGTDTASLTEAQKHTLFEQYLTWRTRSGGATAPAGGAAPSAAP